MFDLSDPSAGDGQPVNPDKVFNRRVLRAVNSERGAAIARETTNALGGPQGIRRLHMELYGYYLHEIEVQGANRKEMAEDEDFYDGLQFTTEDEERIAAMGVKPYVKNVIANALDWVIGTQLRLRNDYKVLGRTKEDLASAERKTSILKYLSDVNYGHFIESAAFKEMVKAGLSWVEDGVRDGSSEPIYENHVSWRYLLHDSATMIGPEDEGRYRFKTGWFDLDVAKAIMPGREVELDRAATDETESYITGFEFDDPMSDRERVTAQGAGSPFAPSEAIYNRQRVRLIEAWFKKPAKSTILIQGEKPGGQFIGEIFDPMSRGHYEDLASGRAITDTQVVMRTYVAYMTTQDLLFCFPSPYRHNRFPQTPMWCYRRARDGMPYGMVRRVKGLNYDLNLRNAAALSKLLNNKTIMDEGAVEDVDEYLEEAGRPDAVIVKRRGHELVMNADSDMAAAHLQIAAEHERSIQRVSGITDELQGVQTNATSGRAIERRQDQGALTTLQVFDNLRLTRMLRGEKKLSLIEQFMSSPKSLRIVSPRGGATFIAVNTWDEASGAVLPEDDITRSKADFIISDQAWSATVRTAQAEALMEVISMLASSAPELALAVLDLAVEMMDIPNRDEIVARIRGVSGQKDPDQEKPTVEDEIKAKKMQEAEDRAIAMEQATIAEKEASAKQKEAQAKLSSENAMLAEIKKVESAVASQMAAIQAALAALAVPAAAPAADEILSQAGFQSKEARGAAAAIRASDAAMAEEQAMAAEAESMAPIEALAAEEQAQQQQVAPVAQPQPNPPGVM
jgi:hypothetical protein